MSSVFAMRLSLVITGEDDVPDRFLRDRFAHVTRISAAREALSIAVLGQRERTALDLDLPRSVLVADLIRAPNKMTEVFALSRAETVQMSANTRFLPAIGTLTLVVEKSHPKTLIGQFKLLLPGRRDACINLHLRGTHIPWHGETVAGLKEL